ncbi:uncharacterized protein PRCAT00001534001 [Priceomyces carsonii]|uniref:uncharacterized protein n=1 Tax=Priceomyces carsonii TaxID=28549 RepID=UPI002ED83355|nr:unnamed protein product [Priceomyces carsonii]
MGNFRTSTEGSGSSFSKNYDDSSKSSIGPFRHISSQRVTSNERGPLLDSDRGIGADSSSHRSSLRHSVIAGSSLGSFANDEDDAKSITYRGYGTNDDDRRLSTGGYIPGTAKAMEDLEWKDIIPYYIPCISWMKLYSFEYLTGDVIGGLTLVFFQLPLAMSYATSLARVPLICGLLSLGISPLMYMIFGSVPQMIVGPEGPILLIVGQAVEPFLHHHKKESFDAVECLVAITFVSGASLLGFGLGRFGFLDNVLCACLLKGFISSVGIVMLINSSVEMLGLSKLLKGIINDPDAMDIHSPFDKFVFLLHNYKKYDPLTFKISIIAFITILLSRLGKAFGTRSYPIYERRIAIIPEILIVLIVSTYMSYLFEWNDRGIEIIGKIKNEGSLSFYNPISSKSLSLIRTLSPAGFSCAMLGFFESAIAAKSLGSSFDIPISSNRELVALGSINIVGSIFGSLPAFGGYGRSKINAIAAKSTLLGAIMGLLTLLTTFFLSGCLRFIPKCILSVISGIIGILLIEEAPYELLFHWRNKGYNELVTFGITVVFTLFFSMEAGIAVGLIYLLIRVIKNSTESRIQILGRYPGTNNFADADVHPSSLPIESPSSSPESPLAFGSQNQIEKPNIYRKNLNIFHDDSFTCLNTDVLEEIEGCLVIKVPEPLTFTNTSDLTTRLKRVEMFGSTKAHPASKRKRSSSMTKYIIFDMDGMVELDSSAAQILLNLLQSYRERHIHSFFVRVPVNKKLRLRLERSGITDLLIKDLNELKYYETNDMIARLRIKRRGSGVSSSIDNPVGPNPLSLDSAEASGIYNLAEGPSQPYFAHITDALKVIDFYENDIQAHSHDYLEIDGVDRRSSLPNSSIV